MAQDLGLVGAHAVDGPVEGDQQLLSQGTELDAASATILLVCPAGEVAQPCQLADQLAHGLLGDATASGQLVEAEGVMAQPGPTDRWEPRIWSWPPWWSRSRTCS